MRVPTVPMLIVLLVEFVVVVSLLTPALHFFLPGATFKTSNRLIAACVLAVIIVVILNWYYRPTFEFNVPALG